MANTKKITRKKIKKNIPLGVAHIHSTFNNTLVSIGDEKGNIISWSSAGSLGFKGSKKSTPYAAQMIAEAAGKTAIEHGMKKIAIEIRGSGPGRDAAIRSLQGVGLDITEINDKTSIPHNGVRPPKRPRG